MELENLGFNALTISFFATIFFSLLAAWGLIDQDRKIWSKKSGQSLSSIWFIWASFFFLSNIIYGSPIFKAVQKKRYKALYRALKKSPESPEYALGERSERSHVDRSVAVPR